MLGPLTFNLHSSNINVDSQQYDAGLHDCTPYEFYGTWALMVG